MVGRMWEGAIKDERRREWLREGVGKERLLHLNKQEQPYWSNEGASR
jgi:hypothetical protein